MSCIRHDLGHVGFISSKTGLKAHVRASVNLVSHVGNTLPVDFFLPKSESWISRAHDFHVSVVTTVGAYLSQTTTGGISFQDLFKQSLSSAKLWTQLGLEASVDGRNVTGDRSSAIRINLKAATTIPTAAGRCQSTHVDVWDVIPPASVIVLDLVSVDIHLHLEMVCEPLHTMRLKPLSQLSIFEYANRQLNSGSQLTSLHSSTIAASSKLSPPGVHESIRTFNNTQYSKQICSPSQTRPQFPTSCTSKSQRRVNEATTVTSQGALALLDAALRTLIVPKPSYMAGVKVTDSRLLGHLVDISPGIFSPGFSANVDARCRFLEPISRFLTAYIARAFMNHMQPPAQDERPPRLKTPNNNNSGDTFSQHLWVTMVSVLASREPTQRLAPLENSRVPYGSLLLEHADLSEEPQYLGGSGDEDLLMDHEYQEQAIFFDLYDLHLQELETSRYEAKPSGLGTRDAQHVMNNEESLLLDTMLSFTPSSGDFAVHELELWNKNLPHQTTTVIDLADSHQLPDSQNVCSIGQPTRHLDVIYGNEGIGGKIPLTQTHAAAIRSHQQDRGYFGGGSLHTSERDDDTGQLFDQVVDSKRDIDLPLLNDSMLYWLPAHRSSYSVEAPLGTFTRDTQAYSHDRFIRTKDLVDAMSGTALTDILNNESLLWHMWKRQESGSSLAQMGTLDLHEVFEGTQDEVLLKGDGMASKRTWSNYLAHSPSHTEPTLIQTSLIRQSYDQESLSSSFANSPTNGSRIPESISLKQRTYHRKNLFSKISRQSSPSNQKVLEVEPRLAPFREVTIKRRKTLEDYKVEEEEEVDEMLFGMLQ